MDDVPSASMPGSSLPASLCQRYETIRARTEALAAPLTPEDQCVQSMPDASPAKWHRAHVTWFFEEFVLRASGGNHRVFDEDFRFLFNSYYEAVGARHPRPMRGLLTRPETSRIAAYRAHVDDAMRRYLPHAPEPALNLVELGLQHEQQHQELLITDMLDAFSKNPLAPALMPDWREPAYDPGPTRFAHCAGGITGIGHDGDGFCFDNETPAHETLLADFHIANRLVRNSEFLSFIEDGGYRTPSIWMSDGWAVVQSAGWSAPEHWRNRDGACLQMGPGGLAPLDPAAPVRHVSWYEADAFARWSGARLPTEFEWEAASDHPDLRELTGHVWQWTDSAYRPYPGYRPAPGAVGEYNGKFMINQMVLRGGSLATPPGHARATYRNFFHPDKRWQFTGLRLARDA
jgi:ergothioneine biosynthesis protein EgtB